MLGKKILTPEAGEKIVTQTKLPIHPSHKSPMVNHLEGGARSLSGDDDHDTFIKVSKM